MRKSRVLLQEWSGDPVKLKAGSKVEVQLCATAHEALNALAIHGWLASPREVDLPAVVNNPNTSDP